MAIVVGIEIAPWAHRVHHDNPEQLKAMTASAASTYSLKADGVELQLIREKFKNVPIHDGDFAIWYGEMAKFIAVNFVFALK